MFLSNRLLIFLFLAFIASSAWAQETCSRIAIVNYQEVLVDTSSNAKGEGLRYYLEKDPKAEALLNKYQKKNETSVWNAAASTVGSALVIAGLLHNDTTSENNSARNNLIYGGLFISAVSYLVVKTTQYNNEKILKSAVDQYNKRNLPRIYFSPYEDNNRNFGVGIGVTQEF